MKEVSMKFKVGDDVEVNFRMNETTYWRRGLIIEVLESQGLYVVEFINSEKTLATKSEVRTVSKKSCYVPDDFAFTKRVDDHVFVYLGSASGKGRGVFAKDDIKKGTEILFAPVLVFPDDEYSIVSSTKVAFFPMSWKGKDTTALPLGLPSLVNHSDKANVEFYPDIKNMCMSVVTIKNVKKDEEITWNYKLAKDAWKFYGIRK